MNDNLLTYLIQQDLNARNIGCFQLTDHCVYNPTLLEVKPNELVYVYVFECQANAAFNVQLLSDLEKIEYNDNNCHILGEYPPVAHPQFVYQSPKISKHHTNFEITQTGTSKFFLRYVRIKIETSKNGKYE